MRVLYGVGSVVVVLVALSTAVQAGSWITSGYGRWDDGRNWAAGTPPQSGDNVGVGVSGAWVDYQGSQDPEALFGALGIGAVDGAYLRVSGATLRLQSLEVGRGDEEEGSFSVQDAGILEVLGLLRLGYFGSGTLGITSGQVVTGDLQVGDCGNASVNQSGGSFSITGSLKMARTLCGNSGGSYTLSGGTLTAQRERFGEDDDAVFYQTGGVHTVIDELEVGGSALSGGGRYELSGGSLYTGDTLLFSGGDPYNTGAIEQSGGTHEVSGQLVLGTGCCLAENARHQYWLAGSGVLVATEEIVGDTTRATLHQNGGNNTVGEIVYIGVGAGSDGSVYHLQNGSLSAAGVQIERGEYRQTGGEFSGELTPTSGLARISGGEIEGSLAPSSTGVVEIQGFAFDLPFGEVLGSSGTISGKLSDGMPIDVPFIRAATATIRLEESPCSGVGEFSRSTDALSAFQENFCEDWSGVSDPTANLESALLSFADLAGANLTTANLSDARLNGAHLANANLSFAELIGSKMIDAQLSSAILAGANLTGAWLEGADLAGAYYDSGTLFPSGRNYAEPGWGLPDEASPWELGMIPLPEPESTAMILVGAVGVAAIWRARAA